MFDKQDARLLAKYGVIVAAGSTLLITIAGVFGLAIRVFGLMAG